MEFRQLEIFRALAAELNFTRAAARARCVQSNVTTQIRLLEEELGVQLFDRLGRSVRLTEAGRRFQPYAERVLNLAEEAKQAAAGHEEPSGTLTISAADTVLTYRLPGFLHAFQRQYPQVELIFQPLMSMRLLDSLRTGEIDAAFVIDKPVSDPSLEARTLFFEPMDLIAHPSHPLSSRKTVKAVDLRTQTLLLTEPGCGYRLLLERALARERIVPSSVVGFSNLEAIKQCVTLGMGIGFLPRVVVQSEVRENKLGLLPWHGTEMSMVTSLVWHKDKWISPAFAAFLRLVDSMLQPKQQATA
jgi:DNA-binding transcriptional LysR family regulator